MAQCQSRILYCDDQLKEQPERVKMLERKGFVVDVALDGATCLQRLGKGAYDVLILDIMMPTGGNEVDNGEADMGYQTGLVVLRKNRNELNLDIPVIIVTAYPGQEVKREIIGELGVAERYYLEKPVPSAVVLERVMEVTAKRPVQPRKEDR